MEASTLNPANVTTFEPSPEQRARWEQLAPKPTEANTEATVAATEEVKTTAAPVETTVGDTAAPAQKNDTEAPKPTLKSVDDLSDDELKAVLAKRNIKLAEKEVTPEEKKKNDDLAEAELRQFAITQLGMKKEDFDLPTVLSAKADLDLVWEQYKETHKGVDETKLRARFDIKYSLFEGAENEDKEFGLTELSKQAEAIRDSAVQPINKAKEHLNAAKQRYQIEQTAIQEANDYLAKMPDTVDVEFEITDDKDQKQADKISITIPKDYRNGEFADLFRNAVKAQKLIDPQGTVDMDVYANYLMAQRIEKDKLAAVAQHVWNKAYNAGAEPFKNPVTTTKPTEAAPVVDFEKVKAEASKNGFQMPNPHASR
jgi:predicted RNA-binding protein Jag